MKSALVLFLFAGLARSAMADPTTLTGSIEAVTVYRGQALVTRAVPLADVGRGGGGGGGVEEVVVTDLPQHIRPESLHTESSPDVQVRSVRFRVVPVVQDTRENVRKLDADIRQREAALAANRRRVELFNEHRAYLGALQQFVAPAATAELTKGVLNAETLEKLSKFLRDSREQMALQELQLNGEAQALQEQIDQVRRERQTLTAGSSKDVYEAVVLVSRAGNGAGQLRLRYLVDGASWSPSYNVRASGQPGAQSSQSTMALEYFASIQQVSGEDWKDVAMTLSTATPSLVSSAPRLTALTLTLGGEQQPAPAMSYADAKQDFENRKRELGKMRAQASSGRGGGDKVMAQVAGMDGVLKDSLQFDRDLNMLANDEQVLDLIAGERADRQEQARIVMPPTEGLSVTYTIAGQTTLPSRSERQQVQIAAVPVAAQFTKVAIPLLTGYVYDQASAANTTEMVLLSGPVTSYADGSFVGSADFPTIASGQAFTAGFGIDSSLTARRELVERTETQQGGNKVVTLTYRLSVENFAGEPAQVRLMDRLAMPQKGSDIRVTLVNSSVPVSEDEEYFKTGRKDGLLRWDVEVPAQATGPSARTVEFTFKMEYDKQMSVVGLGG